MRRREEHTFVRVSGGIITEHFASLLQDEEQGFEYARPVTFIRPWREEDLPPKDKAEFLAHVRDAWERLLRRYDEKAIDIRNHRMSAEEVRRLWQRPVLDALGFEPTSSSRQVVITDRLKYRFSHRGWFAREGVPRPPVVHILPPGVDMDVRPSRGEPSPHDILQDCLNRHDATWAVLMDSMTIRVLRDYHHTTVPGYIEFDLDGIFLNRSFPEFLALYRFCHASRFARDPSTGKEPLEVYYEVSRQAGEKIGENLRVNVVRAIEEFGNGFLDGALIERLRGDDEACRAYYQEILMVVYRIIFMLFAEQRGMLGGGECEDLFHEEYSITSLRERVDAFAERDDRHTDLWEGLSVTFRMLESGVPELGVNAFDGLLFASGAEQFLSGAKCRNTALMNAIRSLTWTVPEAKGHGRQRISYADLSVEEIGAIYESLLDYRPMITESFSEIGGRERRPGEFVLDPKGSERKTTGSYYTNPDLIAELVRSALDPVIADRLSRAGPDPAAREKALFSIRVCDPACGSGAFLIAASNRLGREVAKVRAGTELPSALEVQAARRDVLSRCIYGVDVNPMAVELAKVSLWINALVGDKPLSFLDHHIRCGNSLIGATPDLIEGGIPDGAYTPVEGDSREVANRVKKANREQRRSRTFDELAARSGVLEACAGRFAALADAAEDDPEGVEAKRAGYERLIASPEYTRERLVADCWCAAFFWPLVDPESVPTTATVRTVPDLSREMFEEVQRIAEEHRFFHWYLEFPEVFAKKHPTVDGGFDCVLGNPPWERIKIQEKEFFKYRDPDVAGARNAAERNRKIKVLKKDNPPLYAEFIAAKQASERESIFIRTSGRFPLTGRGDVNTYTVFTELARLAIAPRGRAGIIVPTGIATDATTAPFFGNLVESRALVSLYDIENRQKIFPIDSRFKFCLLTMAGQEAGTGAFDLAFFLHRIEDLHDDDRHFALTPEEILLINPNTKNCPIFRSKRDAEITKAVYRRVPVLVNEGEGEAGNPWGVSFQRMFDMSNDSHLFRTREEMEEAGFVLDGNRFVKGEVIWLPLYEGKMFWHYDHRFGTFEGVENKSAASIPAPTVRERADPEYLVVPWYWINEEHVEEKNDAKSQYFLCFRDIARATDERTAIFSIIPYSGVGNKAPLLKFMSKRYAKILTLANLNSLIFDFNVRQKIGSTSMNFYIVKQLPVLPPSTYTPALTDFIAPRVIELTYTAWDLEPFARDVLTEVGVAQWNTWFPANPIDEAGTPRPFVWDEERRFDLRCDLDALYFHLYNISREDADYIMETFPIVKRKDEAEHGRYRTKEIILQKYDDLAGEFVRVMRADLPPGEGGEPDWRAILAGGENERVEFKASISWDIRNNRKNRALEHTIARTIASFMNTHGGVLFAGVDDAGEVVGLDNDIKISYRKNEDGLRLRFDDLVKNYLGDQFHPRITIHSLEDDGKVFWAVEVQSTSEPVYVKKDGEDEFWIRGASSSRKLSVREAVAYIGRRGAGEAGGESE